jgi:uncharacterized membrane protein YdbT with pleckstrin-like domain
VANKHLNPGESIVFTTRTHVKAIIFPSLLLIVIAGAGGYLLSKVPDITEDHKDIGYGVVLVIMAVLALIFFVWPFLNWLTATYTVTNRRLTTHQGVLTRTGHDIQLTRISDVSYEKGILDRILGCGTLVISDASDLGVKLPDVPKVAERQRIISDLLFQGSNTDDGT